LNESGLPGIDISGWNGFFAPAKVPAEVAAKLNADINAVVKNPAVDQRMRQRGYEPHTVVFADAPAFFKTSIDGWASMIRLTGISAE
jgi:tripartite-type tricarboxylate transporter receptor subunit TctC